MRTSKIIKVGNSNAVSISKKILSCLDWKIGDRVYIISDKENEGIIIRKIPDITK